MTTLPQIKPGEKHWHKFKQVGHLKEFNWVHFLFPFLPNDEGDPANLIKAEDKIFMNKVTDRNGNTSKLTFSSWNQ